MARDLGDELDQLRQLRDSGALSNDEYRRAKAALQGDSAPDSDPEETVPRSTRSKARSGKVPRKRSGTKGLYRDADKLVIREGATLPDRCVICNKESDGEPMDFTFGRLKMHYIELAAAQTVANAAVDLVKGTKYTGPVQAAIPLCSWHRKRRLRRIGIGLGIMALAAAVLLYRYSIAGADEFSVFRISIYSIIAVVAALVGIAITLSGLLDASRVWFRPTKYYDRFVWIQGAGRQYLRTLPIIEDYHYKPNRADPGLSADELIRGGKLEDDD